MVINASPTISPTTKTWAVRLAVGLIALHATPAFCQVVTQYGYDAGDHVTQVTDPRGLVTSYVFDGVGQKWQQVSPDTGTTSFSYDGYGRVVSMTRADGSQTAYGYDGIGRRTSITAGGLTQTFTFDTCTNGIGRLCAAADATGTTSYSYSPEGWMTVRGFSIGGTAYSLGYGYNALGQITTVVYPDGNQALYSYTNGVVSTVQVKTGSTVVNAATGVSYQPNDLAMAQWTAGNGLVNTLSYNADGRLTGISVPSVQSLGLSYDAANRINGITNGIDGAMTQDFGYDAMSRLTSVYSGADNEAFQYDANGNRINQMLNGVQAIVAPSANSNQLVSLSGGTNITYGYDAKGNLTTVSGTPTFAYDAFNRLSSVGSATYYVGPEGQRLRKTVGGTSTYFAPSAGGPLMAENQGGNWSDYVWLNGRLIGRVVSGQLQIIHDDQVGRPEAITDSNQIIVWRARNFAFDRTVTVANTAAFNLGFPGQYYDAESGLWNNGFRDYSPALGGYIESDPMGQAAGVNTYAYVLGNPLSGIDPLGLGTIAAGPALSVSLFAKFDISIQVSVSWNANALADPSQWRIGGVFSISPFTQGSTGGGISGGLLATYSPANNPEVFNGWSGMYGASGGAGIVGGYDVGNLGSGCHTYNGFLGVGVKDSIGLLPAEAHVGASWTAAGSFSL